MGGYPRQHSRIPAWSRRKIAHFYTRASLKKIQERMHMRSVGLP